MVLIGAYQSLVGLIRLRGDDQGLAGLSNANYHLAGLSGAKRG